MFVDTELDLTPDATFAAAMLACVPFAFLFDLDDSIINQEMKRASRPVI